MTDSTPLKSETCEPASGRLLLSAHEAAQSLGICMRTLATLTKCGEVRCVRVRRRVLYDRRDLLDFIDRQKDGAP